MVFVTFRNIMLAIACYGLLFLALFMTACQPQNSDKRTEITFSTWGSAEELKTLKELLAEFEAIHPQIKVRLMHIPENYYQKLHILVASGMTPDVVFTNSISFPVYASHGLFEDLTPYLEKSNVITKDDFFKPSLKAFDAGTVTIGAIPRDVSNLVIFYNADMFRKYGVALPTADWTWQEFLDKAQQLTELRPEDKYWRFGVSFFGKPPLLWLPFLWSNGGRLFNDDFSQLQLDSDVARNALQFYGDLRNRYHVAPQRHESGSRSMSQMFLQGDVAMLVSGRWSVPFLRQKATFDWNVVPFPKGANGSRVGIDASGYAMAKDTKHPEEAWQLIEFMTSPKAIGAFTASGLIVPARLDVASSEAFLSPGEKPKDSQVFIDIIEDGVPTHTPARWNEISEELNLGLEPIWNGDATATDAVKDMTPRIQKILKEGHGG